MRRIYIHQLPDWPALRWRHEELAGKLAEMRYLQGRLVGRMESLGFQPAQEAMLETLTGDVVKSSEIEGELLDAGSGSFLSGPTALGLDYGGLIPPDRDVEGVVEMMLDATQNYSQPLTEERLFEWHSSSVSHGDGAVCREPQSATGVMTAVVPCKSFPAVLSGDRKVVHYEAPAAERVDQEMRNCIRSSIGSMLQL